MERYGGNMEEKDCWNKFTVSGKIEDYLEYCNSVEYGAHNKSAGTQASLIFTTNQDGKRLKSGSAPTGSIV